MEAVVSMQTQARDKTYYGANSPHRKHYQKDEKLVIQGETE